MVRTDARNMQVQMHELRIYATQQVNRQIWPNTAVPLPDPGLQHPGELLLARARKVGIFAPTANREVILVSSRSDRGLASLAGGAPVNRRNDRLFV